MTKCLFDISLLSKSEIKFTPKILYIRVCMYLKKGTSKIDLILMCVQITNFHSERTQRFL